MNVILISSLVIEFLLIFSETKCKATKCNVQLQESCLHNFLGLFVWMVSLSYECINETDVQIGRMNTQ